MKIGNWKLKIIKGVFLELVTIKIRDDESLEQALRRFNREVLREGIIKELRRREFYEKPSTVRKKEKQERSRRAEFLRQEN